jgi:hypothetical protein
MHEKEWRETIINRLVPECGYYYILYDPDYLLGDEKLYRACPKNANFALMHKASQFPSDFIG